MTESSVLAKRRLSLPYDLSLALIAQRVVDFVSVGEIHFLEMLNENFKSRVEDFFKALGLGNRREREDLVVRCV